MSVTQRRVYTSWLGRAICVFTTCRRHRVSQRYLCEECFRDLPTQQRPEYDLIFRHYLHIGFQYQVEECDSCDVVIGELQGPLGCSTCRYIVHDITNAIENNGERHFLEPEPTIVSISQINAH
jgi:hypothetical protein